jgi:hypothetical protein
MRGADAGSDHYLVRATFKLNLLASKKLISNANTLRCEPE